MDSDEHSPSPAWGRPGWGVDRVDFSLPLVLLPCLGKAWMGISYIILISEKTFTPSGVYAPLHPASAFQINDFSYCLRRVFQTGSLCRQSDANRYSALRSHINCKAQPQRVNSVLRTSDNTRLAIVSLTLMAHSVKSTQNKENIIITSIHSSLLTTHSSNRGAA